MKIGISGSSGLIGGRICQRLATTTELIRLGRRSDCDIRVDFCRPETVSAIDLTGCQAVVHCAGIVDEDFKTDPTAAYIQNTVGLASLARRAVACGAERFVYVSSSHVYGPLVGSVSEGTAVNPLSDYAIAHYAAEQTLRRYSLNEGLKVLVLRPNAVFGLPVQIDTFDRWSLIPFSFPLQAVYKQKIVLLTSGEQRRNFVSADDLGRLAEEFLHSPNRFPSFEIVNPVGPATLSVYEFAVKCADKYRMLTGNQCEVERPEPKPGDAVEDFTFGSRKSYCESKDNIDDFLVSFISKILGDWMHVTKYGA